MTRQAHVTRVFSDDGKNWVDILRIDSLDVKASDLGPVRGQEQTIQFKWKDDEGEGFGADRTYEDVTVTPNVNPDNPTATPEPITVKAITSLKVVNSGQEQDWIFKNSPDNQRRSVITKRVYHREVGDLSAPMPWEQYLQLLNAAADDTSSYVDFDVTKSYARTNSGQGDTFIRYTKELDDLFEDAPGDATPVRLDPFQVIVNASWDNKKKDFPFYILVGVRVFDLSNNSRLPFNEANGPPPATYDNPVTGGGYNFGACTVQGRPSIDAIANVLAAATKDGTLTGALGHLDPVNIGFDGLGWGSTGTSISILTHGSTVSFPAFLPPADDGALQGGWWDSIGQAFEGGGASGVFKIGGVTYNGNVYDSFAYGAQWFFDFEVIAFPPYRVWSQFNFLVICQIRTPPPDDH